jgi:hypothetical protein
MYYKYIIFIFILEQKQYGIDLMFIRLNLALNYVHDYLYILQLRSFEIQAETDIFWRCVIQKRFL